METNVVVIVNYVNYSVNENSQCSLSRPLYNV